MFFASAATIALFGTFMSGLADRIADRTGFGEALTGAVLLGASTSISGSIASVWSAAHGYPELAATNCVGGIAAQTAFLVVADISYRRANLEHAAASATNLIQLGVLITMLTLPLMVASAPAVTVLGIHPASPVLVALYLFGLRLASHTHSRPMWRPENTRHTRRDTPEPEGRDDDDTVRLFMKFGGCVAIVAAAGFFVAQSGIQLSERGGLSESLVGSLLTSVATSLPELVTTIAAVRRGALQLAVGGIIGGNTFDVLFLAFSDVAYTDGSLYHVMGGAAFLWISASLLMASILLLGLLRREQHGIGNVGTESVALLAVYGSAIGVQIWLG